MEVILRKSLIQGLGAFAQSDILRGTQILKIDDSRMVTKENPLCERDGEYPYHCDYLAREKTILMQSPERYINHSCSPNSYIRTIDDALCLFALRSIGSGEEITCDYCINGGGDTWWECRCGSSRCRHLIHSDFFHLPTHLQMEYLTWLDGWYIEENRERIRQLVSSILNGEFGS